MHERNLPPHLPAVRHGLSPGPKTIKRHAAATGTLPHTALATCRASSPHRPRATYFTNSGAPLPSRPSLLARSVSQLLSLRKRAAPQGRRPSLYTPPPLLRGKAARKLRAPWARAWYSRPVGGAGPLETTEQTQRLETREPPQQDASLRRKRRGIGGRQPRARAGSGQHTPIRGLLRADMPARACVEARRRRHDLVSE